jgi:ferredoxin-NADP reductase
MILGSLFVLLAAFNVWSMLTTPGRTARSKKLWTELHRAAGYVFIALYLVFCFYMLLRIKGWSDELSPRLVVHASLAFLVGPLLLAKVIAARHQKAARNLLMAIGISIFALSFALVALNLSVHYLRTASTDKLPASTSILTVSTLLAFVVSGYLSGRKRSPAKAGLKDSTMSATAAPVNSSELLTLSLARIESQGRDAKTLRFLLSPGKQIAARPGQFLTFEWPVDGKTVTRSYSICSSPLQKGYVEITPKRVENGCVSKYLNDRAQVGLTVNARGPYGMFCFDENRHRRIALIAGGSGITPMVAMLRYIDDLCIPVEPTLIYCARTAEDLLFKDFLEHLASRVPRFVFVPVLSSPELDWAGWTGHLRREILEQEIQNTSEITFFLCGPPAFMETVRKLLSGLGVDSTRILQESFGGGVAGGKPAAPASGSLTVTLTRSAVVYCTSGDDTLLESAEKNGVLIPSGCRQGECGTCATRLLAGDVRMERQDALTDDQRSSNYILPCVSRPVNDVDLDA